MIRRQEGWGHMGLDGGKGAVSALTNAITAHYNFIETEDTVMSGDYQHDVIKSVV